MGAAETPAWRRAGLGVQMLRLKQGCLEPLLSWASPQTQILAAPALQPQWLWGGEGHQTRLISDKVTATGATPEAGHPPSPSFSHGAWKSKWAPGIPSQR